MTEEPQYDFSGLELKVGQTAVVSGAASGIGRSVTGILVRSGVAVQAWDIDEQRFASPQEEFSAAPGKITCRRVDTSADAEIEAAWKDLQDSPIQLLVNNAAPPSTTELSVAEGVRQEVGGYAANRSVFGGSCRSRAQHHVCLLHRREPARGCYPGLVSGGQGWRRRLYPPACRQAARCTTSQCRRAGRHCHRADRCRLRRTGECGTFREISDGSPRAFLGGRCGDVFPAVARGVVYQQSTPTSRGSQHMEQQQLSPESDLGTDEVKSQYLQYRTFTDYPIFDADQHLTEGDDCYTRHIESKYKGRTLRIEVENGKTLFKFDGNVRESDGHKGKVPHPGSLKELLKGIKKGSGEAGTYQWMDPDPAFADPDLRLEQLDKQNIEAWMLYSTGIGLLAEHVLTDDDLFYASNWSYLRWLEEEWGFARANACSSRRSSRCAMSTAPASNSTISSSTADGWWQWYRGRLTAARRATPTSIVSGAGSTTLAQR